MTGTDNGLPPGDLFDLLDWKRRIFALYQEVRAAGDPEGAWKRWRDARDELFATHPQSPLPADDRDRFDPGYFDYDEGLRALGRVEMVTPERYEVGNSDGSTSAFVRFATAAFQLAGESVTLELYWLQGYGGGLFLPFRDATNGAETYGAGRYLLDTVKGADLGMEDGRLVLDFNFAYNPSCAYDARWICPLAPPPNRLEIPVRAGERYDEGAHPRG